MNATVRAMTPRSPSRGFVYAAPPTETEEEANEQTDTTDRTTEQSDNPHRAEASATDPLSADD